MKLCGPYNRSIVYMIVHNSSVEKETLITTQYILYYYFTIKSGNEPNPVGKRNRIYNIKKKIKIPKKEKSKA